MAKKKVRQGEPITENRRVRRLGSSYYLNLPPEWIKLHQIKPGSRIPITADHILMVIPHAER